MNFMKRALGILTFIIVIAAVLYSGVMGYRTAGKGHAVLAVSKSTGKPVAAYSEKHNFIPYGLIFWKYSIETTQSDYSFDIKLEVPLNPFKELNSKLYDVSVPVHVHCSVFVSELKNLSLLQNNGASCKSLIEKQASGLFAMELQPYFATMYRGNIFANNFDTVFSSIENKLKDRMAGFGVKLNSFSVNGILDYPSRAVYNEGLIHLREMRDLTRKNEKNLVLLKNSMQQDRLKTDDLYRHYREMSKIIEENPDILKYIYIDKMANDLDVIISSDKQGYPVFIDKNDTPEPVKKTGDIDNLR
jgi:hypothetical protein